MKNNSKKSVFRNSRNSDLQTVIDQSWSYVEFTSTGIVINANENFIKLFGYESIDEIVGNHHQIFCKTEFVEGTNYEKFWEDLRLGKRHLGEFERITKTGNSVWINASYSPVMDDNGNVIKIMKIAADISQQKISQQQAQGIQSVVDEGWAFIEFNPDGTVINANENFIQLFNYESISDIKGQHHQMFCDEIYIKTEEYKTFWKNLRSGEQQSGEFERVSKSGKQIWINASYSPVMDDNGNVIKIMKIAADISQQKISQQQAQGIQSVVDEGWAFIEFNPDGTVINANENFIQLFNYESISDIKGQHHQMFCDEIYIKTEEYKTFWKNLRSGEQQSGEFERVSKSGKQIWINASYSPVMDDNGNVVKIMKIAADISQQKISQQQAEGIQSVVDEGWAFIEFNPDGTVINANENFIQLFGYESISDIKGQHHQIFCDEIYVKTEEYKTFWKNLRSGEQQSGEFERVSKSGKQIWINASYSPIKDDNGNVIKIMKIAADISAEKQLEAEIKEIRRRDLKDVQNQLIQSEKMATLGNLMAGIAHEINTPLGAIKASIEGILDNDDSYKNFHKLLKVLPEDQIALFFEMIDESVNIKVVMSSKEERQAKRKLRKELEDLGLDNAENIADMMSDLHLLVVVDKYQKLIKNTYNDQIFNTAMDVTVQYRNGGTIKIAVDKASKIIFALKSYSHFDQEDEFSETNILEGIENVITLYSNQLKQGTELIKDYDTIPLLKCLPDQLGQVWTNLISNAIHAMKGIGTLRIEVKEKLKSVIVNIGDSGEGIPPDVAKHIFTPFFTTKSSGEGSGLGLDLVKKIIDKHGGKICFSSEPGNTVFSVEIPKKEHIEKLIILRYEELQKAEENKEEELRMKIVNFE